ncbi:MAG TPA: trypsin-like peptidase domain-containing protein [Acidimicrobiales bacterium]|jgi:S1-C subfamily serine protease|nr:trypsin-like peptidase domain-containing protein [Acidimicrobiales bacterium]
MTEDQNDQSTGPEAVSGAETPAAAESPTEQTGGAIAMPAASTAETPETPAPAETASTPAADTAATPVGSAPATDATPLPQQPDTPPQGVPQGPPTGGYAMGALAGNPMLGATPPPPYGGPPTDPNAPFWPAPPAAGAASSGHRDNRVRNGLLAGGAALVVLAAGIGIGHAAWTGGTQIPSAASSNNNQIPARGNNGGSNPSRIVPGNTGNTGNGNSNSGSSGPSDVSAIAAKVDPGLVDINTTLGYQQEQAAGTGIVLTSGGEVLTNNHVIDGATSISVTDVGNKKTYTASVVGYDRTSDVAVLQLHNASGLQTADLGNSANISVGEDVVGIGNAGGTGGTPSAAGGSVTALNQSITAQDDGDGTSEQLSGLIQTNANIQPGDSGGALVNSSGQVLGMDTAASAGFSFQFNGQSQGNQGFAIPINTALSLARSIEAGNGSSTIHIGATAFLGVEVSPSGSGSSAGNGTGNGGGGGFGGFFGNSGSTGNTGSSSSSSGAAVAGVVTNGPAQEAGLAQGDVITSIGGKSINSANDLTGDMGIYHPGDKAQVGWTDANGQTHTATVQLSSGPPQ